MKLFSSLLVAAVAVALVVRAQSPSFTSTSAPSYTAHEWGTFTSVQGADGVQMAWNPESATELPKFVYRDALNFKSAIGFLTTQRLETPVIYFHADAPLSVDVQVAFPDGRLTEWYPAAPRKEQRLKRGVRWPNVSVIPRNRPGAAELEAKLPSGQPGSHYYAAREAEADFVRARAEDGNAEVEKFLFYRGVGDFLAPLKVTVPNPTDPTLRLENTDSEPLRSVVVIRVDADQMTISQLGDLQGNSSTVARAGSPVSLEEGRKQLGGIMRDAVARAGLTPSEAAAMVKTWDQSWFSERGVRVLYVPPRDWVDPILPLFLKPAPRQLERVLVGRAEVITPSMEKALGSIVDTVRTADAQGWAKAADGIRALGLGRFLMPAFHRVAGQRAGDAEFTKLGFDLLQIVNPPPAPAPTQ
jgi:hypothetical protein